MSLAQLDFFDVPAAPLVQSHGDPDGLRPYQREAVRGILEAFTRHDSTVLVMATGLGKTQTFGAVAAHWPGRVLVLAHRDELIEQARKRMAAMTGEWVGLEQAGFYAGKERIVVGSVQTMGLCGSQRIERFTRDPFKLVIVDEAHHATARTYRNVLESFPLAKVLGVTATPDRGDGKALGEIFQSVAYRRDIRDGLDDGYLVPVRVRRVLLQHVDLSAVKTTAGDLNLGQLDLEVAKELEGIADSLLRFCDDRKTIVFATSVATAHDLCAHVNRQAGRVAAVAVDGKTEDVARRQILSDHRAGKFQFLVNVGIATEGYDSPEVSCVAIARPTKSRALYAQMAGRGLRVLPGLVEDLEDADLRRAAIAASSKPDCLLLDFVGNAGRHKLVSPLDILGGKPLDDDERDRAEAILSDGKEHGADAAAAESRAQLEAERKERAAKIARLRSKTTAKVIEFDPFGGPGGGELQKAVRSNPPTEGQLTALGRFGFSAEELGRMSKHDASKAISRAIARSNAKLASHKQERFLARHGIDARRMYFETASKLMAAFRENGWRRLPQSSIQSIIGAGREPGQEG